VIGVSCDSEEQQAEYAAKAKSPFLLFSDERRSAVEMLGIQTVADGNNVNVAKPIAIAVDREGVVRAIIDKVDPARLADDLLRALSEPIPAGAA
jgi:peroxiredoxin